MILIPLAGDDALVHPVMRQNASRLLIAPRSELVDVIGQRLPHALDVVDHMNGPARELRKPYARRIRHANVEEGPDLEQRINVKLTNAPLALGLGKQVAKVRSAYRSRIATFPHMVIGAGVGPR